MICPTCKGRNPIGNRFCRDCGGKLDVPENVLAAEEAARLERERLQERVAGLLSVAFTLSEQKRYSQAIAVGEEAAMLMPDSTAAHSLLAMLYERSDNMPKAIAEMERVVALNPESPADYQKLDQLRRGVHIAPRTNGEKSEKGETPGAGRTEAPAETVAPVNSPRRVAFWFPFVAAGAMSAIVLGVGLSVINSFRDAEQRRSETAAETATAKRRTNSPVTLATTGASPASPAAATSAYTTPTATAIPPGAPAKGAVLGASQVRDDPFVSLGNSRNNATAPQSSAAAAQLDAVEVSARRRARQQQQQSSLASALPLPFRPTPRNNSGDDNNAGNSRTLPPIIAVAPSTGQNNLGANLSAGSGNGFGNGSRITAGPPQTTPPNPAAAAGTTAGNGDGYIRITVGSPRGGSAPDAALASSRAASNSDSGSSPEGPMTRARRLQSSGRYADAVSAYQEALQSGAGPSGEIHQGIGQCYHHQGNDGAARTEYQTALRAYESQAASGRNVGAAQRGISACKAALEGLGG